MRHTEDQVEITYLKYDEPNIDEIFAKNVQVQIEQVSKHVIELNVEGKVFQFSSDPPGKGVGIGFELHIEPERILPEDTQDFENVTIHVEQMNPAEHFVLIGDTKTFDVFGAVFCLGRNTKSSHPIKLLRIE